MLRWIIKGMMLMEAPIIEHTPVAIKPINPSLRLRGVLVMCFFKQYKESSKFHVPIQDVFAIMFRTWL